MSASTPTMRILSSHAALASAGGPSGAAQGSASATPGRVVAIGNFDGVHLAHQQILRDGRRLADLRRGELVVFTFWPHPARVLAPARAPRLLTTRARRRELLAACGVDVLIEETFDAGFAAQSPAAFVDDILIGALGAAEVCVGYDFTFGKGRAGDTGALQALLARHGAHVTVTPAFSVSLPTADGGSEPVVCSSTRVRRELQEGAVGRAALLLGRPPELCGTIVHGAGRGRTIGVPTANLEFDRESDNGEVPMALPATGVYAAWAEVTTAPGPLTAAAPVMRYPAAVNVGYNPTFQRGEEGGPLNPPLSIEAHLIQRPDAAPLPPLYGHGMRLGFVARLRAEQRFAAVADLVAQIRADIADATRALAAT